MRNNTFGYRLKIARQDAHMTQKDVAKELNISQTILSRYETDKLEPNIETLCKLIDLYGISANWLLGVGKYMED